MSTFDDGHCQRKFVAYYRVSTRAQSRSGLGLDAQRDTIKAFVAQNGELVAEFVEVASGRKDGRSELTKAIKASKDARGALIIARLDRFSRRVSFIASVMESGISLVVADMPGATEFQLHIFAALAQEERRLISERTKKALAQAKKRGILLGRNSAVIAEQNRATADRFAETIESHLPDGWETLGYSTIARFLNENGISTARGNRFYPQTVKSISQRLRRLGRAMAK